MRVRALQEAVRSDHQDERKLGLTIRTRPSRRPHGEVVLEVVRTKRRMDDQRNESPCKILSIILLCVFMKKSSFS